jgi:hypothetical protein
LRFRIDFFDGEIARNVLDALEMCEISVLSELRKKEIIRFQKTDNTLTNKSLLYSSLDMYCEATGHSLRYFLFGSEDTPVPSYTQQDKDVVTALNSLNPDQLNLLKNAIQLFYYSPIMEQQDLPTPAMRFVAAYRSRGLSVPDDLSGENADKYRLDIVTELHRFKRAFYSPLFNFLTDYWPDLAVFVGVSVRWLLGVKNSKLYCSSSDADDVFDLYTLMAPIHKRNFIGLLSRLSPGYFPELDQYFMDQGVV